MFNALLYIVQCILYNMLLYVFYNILIYIKHYTLYTVNEIWQIIQCTLYSIRV